MTEVYSATTAPNPKSSCCLVPSEHLDTTRFGLKIAQVLCSFLAFVLEESVYSCLSCSALYFFEFVSCTAFLFTLLLLVLLSTTLHTRVGITCWPKLDFVYTVAITLLLFISSIVFASSNSGSSLEKGAVVFGFLASVAFAADVFYFWKTVGVPFQRAGIESSNTERVDVPAVAEAEKLNSVANGAE